MNVLLIGSGGREHAFAWKLSQSPLLDKLFIAPGNAGTEAYGENLSIDPLDFDALKQAVAKNGIELVIVGPEVPLVKGLKDELSSSLPDVHVIGPGSSGAQLEGSKAYAKEFMGRHGIPTAAYREFSSGQLKAAHTYIRAQSLPIVLKADGLAAGKGVIICNSHDEAIKEIGEMLSGKFGSASAKVVIEEFLNGIEFSVFAVTDGRSYQLLPIAKDYKRIGEGDTGLNTGGMGSISPVPFVDKQLMQKVEERIVQPTIQGISNEGLDYRGFLFFGLIEVNGDPYVIEYNCRMGDPETQSVLPRIQTDMMEICLAVAQGKVKNLKITFDSRTVASVVMVSGGYPGRYEKGKEIMGINGVSDSLVFYAGVKKEGQKLLTSGGRVLAVTSFGSDMSQAIQTSYQQIQQISFDGAYYREDIGFDL